MDFYDELETRGMQGMLRIPQYKSPDYVGWQKVKTFLLDIVRNQKSVYVVGDYDVDGLMCALIIKDSLKALGIKDFYVYRYRSRTHNIDRVSVQQCIQKHFDYFIVADTGSSDVGLINRLTDCGIKVIVLDHHNTELSYNDYNENIAVINTTVENRYSGDFSLSAGALCFTVFDKMFAELGKETPVGLASYAAVSLLADIVDMSNELNRAIYFLGTRVSEEELPRPLVYFKGEYHNFNARYIGYWFSPRINACFRAEQFIYLNQLFIEDSDAAVKSKCIELIEKVYVESRNLVHKVTDVLEAYTIRLQNFVFADLRSVEPYFSVEASKLYNYTGYIANGLANKLDITAVVVCDMGNYYKGSLRDRLSRNYLNVFKQICYARGHNAAFGIKIPKLDIGMFLDDLHHVDDLYSIQTVENEPIVIDIGVQPPDFSLLSDIARYNEFSGPNVPVALLRKQFIGNIREQHSSYGYRYAWDDVVIQSNRRVSFGRYVLLKPYYSWKLKLEVQ